MNGKQYHGIIYGALNDKGEQVGTPFKSSKLGKPFGYEALQGNFTRSTERVKKNGLTDRTRHEITKAMQSIGTKEDFAARLKKAEIEVVYRINTEGRLYGITFIDHMNRTVFNGSRLGKGFSANVFNELFNNPEADRERLIPPLQLTEETPREQPVETHVENEQERKSQQPNERPLEPFEKWDEYSALGAVDILSDLLEDDHTCEYIDPAFRFGCKKKKKRRRPRL